MNDDDSFKIQLKNIVDKYGDSLFLEPKKFFSIVSDEIKECEVEMKMFRKILNTDLLGFIYKYRRRYNTIESKVKDIARIELLDFNQLLSFTNDLLFSLGINIQNKNVSQNTVTNSKQNPVKTNINQPNTNNTLSADDLCNLGDEAYQKREYEKAYRYYEEAMNKGNLKAELNIGLMLLDGIGVSKDIEKGFKIIYKVAKEGLVDAYIALGDCYHYGKGVKTDFEKGFHWYKKAAKAGSMEGNYLLGIAYSRGFGVPRLNYRKAKKYFRLAADQGHQLALEELNKLYEYNEDDYDD